MKLGVKRSEEDNFFKASVATCLLFAYQKYTSPILSLQCILVHIELTPHNRVTPCLANIIIVFVFMVGKLFHVIIGWIKSS